MNTESKCCAFVLALLLSASLWLVTFTSILMDATIDALNAGVVLPSQAAACEGFRDTRVLAKPGMGVPAS